MSVDMRASGATAVLGKVGSWATIRRDDLKMLLPLHKALLETLEIEMLLISFSLMHVI